jgi:cytochrome c-type biogenesis protein CcmH/NrfG
MIAKQMSFRQHFGSRTGGHYRDGIVQRSRSPERDHSGDVPGSRMSARYAKSTKPPKKPQRKLSTLQLVAVIFTGLVICSMIGGVTASIVLDSWSGSGDDEAAVDGSTDANDDVLHEMETAAAENPQDAEAQAALGNYYANTDNFDLAVTYYEKAVQLSPEDWTIRLTFAQALMTNQKLSDAELQFDKILEAEPHNATAWYYLGQLYEMWNPPRDDEAIFAYQQVIRYGPDTYVATQAVLKLSALGATPIASPAATPEATP